MDTPNSLVAVSRAVVSAAADLAASVERVVVGDGRVRTARGNAYEAICADRARAQARDEMDALVRSLLAQGPRPAVSELSPQPAAAAARRAVTEPSPRSAVAAARRAVTEPSPQPAVAGPRRTVRGRRGAPARRRGALVPAGAASDH